MKAGGTYSYQFADLADILTAIREPMMASGLAEQQELSGGRDGWTTLTTTIWHESGESKVSLLDIPTAGKSAQESGSLFTYYKRYALGAALGIATEEDDDGKAAGSPTQPATVQASKESDADVLNRAKGKINEALESRGITVAVQKKALIAKVLGHSTIDTLDEADVVMNVVEQDAA